MNSFKENVLRAVSDNNMLRNGDSVLVALSGGADSVSLLYVLLELRAELNLTIYAAHVNHNLRGDEALRDESFVRGLCQKLGIELLVKSADISKIAAQQGIGTELCGRNVRYGFFAELSDKLSAKVATAHTASDNAETVLFNLTRGAGLNGLSGIRPVRDNIIRPLIYVTRAQVEAYCRENSIEFVTDSTNLGDEYTRNKIRHGIVPVCREINPDFENTITESSALLREFNSFLEVKSDEAIKAARVNGGYDCGLLSRLPSAVKLGALYSLCRKNGVEPDNRKIRLIAGCLASGGSVDLNGSVRAVCRQGLLRFVNYAETDKEFSGKELKSDIDFIFAGKQYTASCPPDIDLFSDNPPVFRQRKPGDRFTLYKRNVTKTLKKLFNELKIPSETRGELLVLAAGNEIFWAETVGFSKKGTKLRELGLSITVKEMR